jgi:hypothetical protein
MTTGTIVWLVLAAVCATLFFGIAAAVSIYGIRDLRKLLRGSEPRRKETGRQST